ncbi:MAG: HNH endonuclease signature motif containing protein [Pseudonocardiaceae bacterium]
MVRQLVPEGLAQTAPGPELAAALAGLDLHALTGPDLVEVLRAQARQLSHEQAQLLAVMAEVGYCDPHADPDEVARLAQASDYAADEIRAALAWTRNAAYREYHFAHTLLARLPAVFTALDGGVICRSKAWLFTELCAELTDEQAQLVCDRLLPDAGRLTTGELAARIKKLVIALDPDWAARRYARAVRDRDVIGWLDEDGAAAVTGRRLPAEQAAAACARIEDLAKAAKRAGHPGRIGPLRADIYLGLLDGRWAHHTREEIIADLLAQAGSDDTPQKPAPNDTSRNTTPEDDPDATSAAPADGDANPTAANQRVGVELRVGLSTLLGHDRHPGEVPGWGPVTAETARTLAATQRTGEWRYALTDLDGQLILAGVTRARSTIPEDHKPGTRSPAVREARAGIVELHLPVALLTELATHPHTNGPWAAVIADLAAQYATHHAPGARGGARQDPAARFAGAALRRHVQIRDRVCVYPGCRCPARHADLDHTLDHGRGGLTTDTNSGPLCRHDHRLKHDGGWRLTQPESGHFVWRSPLGRIYHAQPQPISTDLPSPLPRPEQYPDYLPPATPGEDELILYRPPPAPDPASPLARAVDPDEPPPF